MTDHIVDTSLRKTARIAGLLYLILFVVAPFSLMYVPNNIIVPEDAAATANNIMASEGLFRLGIVGDSVLFLTEIVLAVILYVLLKPVSKTLSLVIGIIGELPFMVWLLVKGVKDQPREDPAY